MRPQIMLANEAFQRRSLPCVMSASISQQLPLEPCDRHYSRGTHALAHALDRKMLRHQGGVSVFCKGQAKKVD